MVFMGAGGDGSVEVVASERSESAAAWMEVSMKSERGYVEGRRKRTKRTRKKTKTKLDGQRDDGQRRKKTKKQREEAR